MLNIPDLFRLNDWDIRKFNIFIWSILVAYDFSFISNISNIPLYSIEILSKILGFIILTFIPGYIILRIFKVHDIGRVVNFLLAFGFSLSFIMIFGFGVNIFLPYMGISKPISTFPLFYALNVAILVLIIICYFRDKEFSSSQDGLCIKFSPMLFFLILLPMLSIFGTYVMNYYNSNTPTMILLFIISLFPLLVALNKIPKNLYPFMILSVSISILYNLNLISTHLWSYDIFYEAYSSHYVLQNGVWNPSNISMVPLLLFTILSPVYSLLCDLNVVWVLKIIFPTLFSFTPLALYQIYQKLDFGDYKLSSEMAALSVFVFVFFYGFFKSLPDKQHIAELFLTFILILITIDINTQKRIILFIFSFSLVASHYGISYLFMSFLIFVFIINKFKILNKFKVNTSNSFLTTNYTILFSILTVSWFIYVSGGYGFEEVVRILNHFLINISGIFQADDRSGVSYALRRSQSTLWVIHKLIHLILQFFAFIGVLKLSISILNNKTKSLEIALFSIFLYILVLIQIFKSFGMGFDRIFQISLIFLSPLLLWGFIAIITFFNDTYTRFFSQRLTLKSTENPMFEGVINKKNPYKVAQLPFALFLMIFFLFSSGFVFEVTGDSLPSYCINLNNSAGWPVYSESEVCGVNWLKHYENGNDRIAVFNQWTVIKSRDGLLLGERFYSKNLIPIQIHTKKLYKTYIFLGKYSMDKVQDGEEYVDLEDTRFCKYTLNNSNKLYNSGKSNLYLSKDFEDSQSIFSADFYYDLNSDGKGFYLSK